MEPSAAVLTGKLLSARLKVTGRRTISRFHKISTPKLTIYTLGARGDSRARDQVSQYISPILLRWRSTCGEGKKEFSDTGAVGSVCIAV